MSGIEHSHGESVRTNVDCTAKKRDETNEMQERERPNIKRVCRDQKTGAKKECVC